MADDQDETCGFRINTEYAKKYNTWREKEELQKLKDRYGGVEEDDESSTSESEDEDAEGLTANVEKDWLRTFAAVKTKNPKIYDKNVRFFKEDEDQGVKEKPKKDTAKPMYLKDYERKVILEKGGVVSESEDEDDEEENGYKPGYYEEQEEIKESITNTLKDVDSDSDDDLLVERTKSKDEKDAEEEGYRDWLKGQKQDLDEEVKTDLEPLKEVWSDPNLEEGDRFLRDYILNKRYLEDDDDDRIPTYDEITRDPDLSDDEVLVEKQETFERKFNFRFEEPDAEFIRSYPRTLGDSVRRKDERRKNKRAEIKERKEKEKLKKKEELKQLKNLKRREIMSKLDQLKQITGNEVVGISEADIEGDFDPKQYDKLMEKVFNEDYYDVDDEEKPSFPNDEEVLEEENWDEWAVGPTGGSDEGGAKAGVWEPTAGTSNEDGNYEPHCEDPDFIMDADYNPNQDRSFGLDGRSKKKKKSKFKQILEKKKPEFDPSQKSFEEYLDEYYKLDYEDMIGDLPCRFKYRQVTPNDYGLSTDEVLKCDDKELNTWVSLKKMSQYKTEEDEYFDKRIYSKKARNYQKKLNILHSLAESDKEEEEEDEPQERQESNTMKKKRRKRLRQQQLEEEMGSQAFRKPSEEKGSPGKKNSKGKTSKVSDERREADASEDGPAKKKKKQNEQVSLSTAVSTASPPDIDTKTPTEITVQKTETPEKGKGKKRKPKKQGPGVMSDERLKAFGINPKKFKYTHLPKLKEKQKKEKQSKKQKVS